VLELKFNRIHIILDWRSRDVSKAENLDSPTI
jgi:hypothetical protein